MVVVVAISCLSGRAISAYCRLPTLTSHRHVEAARVHLRHASSSCRHVHVPLNVQATHCLQHTFSIPTLETSKVEERRDKLLKVQSPGSLWHRRQDASKVK